MALDRYKIKDWPDEERPRERLFQFGADRLSDAELLAIILRSGSRNQTAVDLARHLLQKFHGLRGLDKQRVEVLVREHGLGPAKAAMIKAALALSRRMVKQAGKKRRHLNGSQDVYDAVYLIMRDLSREEFRVIYLTGRNEMISDRLLFEGTLNESVVSPREIILSAVQQSAASVILIHNHPSGDPSPSKEDRQVTGKIKKACAYCDITVLDHVIIGRDSYFSFSDKGLMT